MTFPTGENTAGKVVNWIGTRYHHFMLRRILRLFLKIFLSLVTVLALLLGVIYTYNHWPRQIEPDLWTEEDLNLPPIPKENGWDLLPERGDLREEGFDFSINKIKDYELLNPAKKS